MGLGRRATAALFLLVSGACNKPVPDHLRPPSPDDVASSAVVVRDAQTLVEALVGRDPLLRTSPSLDATQLPEHALSAGVSAFLAVVSELETEELDAVG